MNKSSAQRRGEGKATDSAETSHFVSRDVEHLADGLVLARHSQAHVVTVGLEELNGAKDLADSLDGAIQVALSEQLLG